MFLVTIIIILIIIIIITIIIIIIIDTYIAWYPLLSLSAVQYYGKKLELKTIIR